MIIPFPRKKEVARVEAIYGCVAAANGVKVPVFASPVAAGSPVLAEDYTEGMLDLNSHLVKNPEKTFIVKVSGDSMIDAGIHPEDLLVVDQGKTPENGHIVVAALNGELTVKRLCFGDEDMLYLMPENSGYSGAWMKSPGERVGL